MTCHRLVALVLSIALVYTPMLLAGCAASGPATSETEPAAEQAEQQVNVGYGAVPKSKVTGAVSSVDPDDIGHTVARLEDLLIGRVAGVDVQRTPGGVKVVIRGTSSLYGSNEPLYVVDGMTVMTAPGGGLPGINPADIASIEILKDAGSAAIYGSRGANGVIVITTKRAVDD